MLKVRIWTVISTEQTVAPFRCYIACSGAQNRRIWCIEAVLAWRLSIWHLEIVGIDLALENAKYAISSLSWGSSLWASLFV